MDIAKTMRLEEQGVILDLQPGVPLSLEAPENIWVVLEGKLDLFLVEMRDGDHSGARHHFIRVEAGNPVMGFGKLPDAGFGVIANPAVGSKVLCLERKQLQQAASGSPESVLPLIDKWVENLGVAVAHKPAPKDFHILTPGAKLLVEGKPSAILPLAGVVWIRHRQGSSWLLADDQMPPIESGRFFPVSRLAWLHSAPPAQTECFNTRDWLVADPQWQGLRHFQEQVFAYLVVQWRRNDQKEKARLQAAAEADASVFEAALYKLAGTLRGGEKTLLEAESGVLDPLLQVCRLVGDATGIQFPLVPRALEIIKQREPVNAIAQAARVRTRQVMLKGAWWHQESGPMVGFLDPDKRPVALLPGRRGYQLYDPGTRAQTPLDEELAAKLHGFAYVFYRPFPSKALTLRDILAFGLKDCGGDAATVLLMGIAAGLLGLATPVFTGIIFDTIIPGAQHATLAEFSIFLVISAVATALFTLTRSLATLRLQSKMEATIQAAVWDRLLALPVPFFRNFTSGDLARRSLGISQIREALTGSALSSILTGIFSITSGALMFYYSWRLALIAAVLVHGSFLVFTFCGCLQVRILRDVSTLGGRISGMTLQFINGIAKFRVAGTEARAFAVWAREFAKQRVLSMRARKISNLVSIFDSAFPVLAWAVIFYCAASLMTTSGAPVLTTGEFLAFMAAFVQFSTGALELSSAVISVLNVIPLYERAKPILTSLPEVLNTQTAPPELTGSIDIHHVSFRYRDEGPLVLRDLSLSIPPGKFVAFVGPSGSGKSTLFRLLLGFETAGSGAIYFDGQDLADLDVQAVRRQIGAVLQNAKLMTGSIFRNIVGDGTLTIDDAWDAARLAGLEEDLKAMPMGM
ncbi:MAG TPA: NHLP bacteriocin export ABC transporter permease/ATPase subunit, partial [Terriglobia bacterium]|nr:NHLP bacteriocin export ABC transporter permease/ATPase subunit [Terriglobia bacterium]